MKFWKQTLLTTFLFSAIIITFLYSACEKDACTNVTCYNSGACGNGKCNCPTGYEGSQCAEKSVTRFVGVYPGYTSCNGGAQVIDTVAIYADTSSGKMINYVWVVQKSIAPIVLHGYVQYNESNYSVIVPEATAPNYYKIYDISLQNNKNLNIYSYEQNEMTAGDTIVSKCYFVGAK